MVSKESGAKYERPLVEIKNPQIIYFSWQKPEICPRSRLSTSFDCCKKNFPKPVDILKTIRYIVKSEEKQAPIV